MDPASTSVASTVSADSTPVVIDSSTADQIVDADPGAPAGSTEFCKMTSSQLAFDATGPDVACLQRALTEAGFYSGEISGTFSAATFSAVEALQEDRGLFVDGVVGRESAISLDIWPDEQSLVVRTPAPADGAVDLAGFALSSVASAGSDAPPLPPDSGSGRRIVYSRSGQRIWAVGDSGEIVRSWLVSGSKYGNELPGTHAVYSRSEQSTAWNGKAYLPLMVRWLKTERGALGFHAIPLHVEDGEPYQTEAELGLRLSGGCQRQANRDAEFMWDFGTIGTPVIVV